MKLFMLVNLPYVALFIVAIAVIFGCMRYQRVALALGALAGFIMLLLVICRSMNVRGFS